VQHPKKRRRLLKEKVSEQPPEVIPPDVQPNDVIMAGDHDLGMEVEGENLGGFDGNEGGIGECDWLTFRCFILGLIRKQTYSMMCLQSRQSYFLAAVVPLM